MLNTPTSPAAPLQQGRVSRERAPGIGPCGFVPVALVAGALAFLLPTALGIAASAVAAHGNEYAGLLAVAGLAVGVLASPLGVAAGALSARALSWHSRGAMWLAGLGAGAAVLPALALVTGVALAL